MHTSMYTAPPESPILMHLGAALPVHSCQLDVQRKLFIGTQVLRDFHQILVSRLCIQVPKKVRVHTKATKFNHNSCSLKYSITTCTAPEVICSCYIYAIIHWHAFKKKLLFCMSWSNDRPPLRKNRSCRDVIVRASCWRTLLPLAEGGASRPPAAGIAPSIRHWVVVLITLHN